MNPALAPGALQKPEPRATTKARRGRAKAKRDAAVYAAVTARDGGACRCCGSHNQIARHHLIQRSLQGPTTTSNVVCLCVECHRAWHDRRLHVSGVDANAGLYFQWGRP